MTKGPRRATGSPNGCPEEHNEQLEQKSYQGARTIWGIEVRLFGLFPCPIVPKIQNDLVPISLVYLQ